MRYPDYLVHFNPNHDPKTGQFAPGEKAKENKRLYKAMKKRGATAKNFRNDPAIKKLSNDKRLLKARDNLLEKYDKYQKTGWPGGLESAADDVSFTKMAIIRDFIGKYNNNNPAAYFKGNADSFSGDWRDSIFADTYGGRISHLINLELGIDDAMRYWQPDKSDNGYNY